MGQRDAGASENNIKAAGFGKQTFRFVTHLDFNDDMDFSTEDLDGNLSYVITSTSYHIK